MITKKLFDRYNDKDIYLYELTNDVLQVGIINFGATIQYIKFKNKDVCLGFNSVKEYLDRSMYCGSTIGRVANRIQNARFRLNENEYVIPNNDGKNASHGGTIGFDKKVYYPTIYDNILSLSLISHDGDMGFPGELLLNVEFELVGNSLEIRYFAKSDKDTIWSPTAHTYFNLNGTGNIYNHLLMVNASKYLPVDEELIPTGEIFDVQNTSFDFKKYKAIGKDINENDLQLKNAGGYDHNFALDQEHAASVIGDMNKIKLDIYTDMPGIQFYSGNFIKDDVNDTRLAYRSHFCLEPQYFPNAINEKDFEAPIIRANEIKKHYIRYEFEEKK